MTGMSVSKLKTFNAGVKGSTLGASGPQYVIDAHHSYGSVSNRNFAPCSE